MHQAVITGLAVFSVFGIKTAEIQKNLESKYFSNSEIIEFSGNNFLKIKGYDPKNYLGDKGLRFFDPAALLIGGALKQVLDDTNVLKKYSAEDICFVLGLDWAAKSRVETAKEIVKDPIFGPSPGMAPNISPNGVAGQLAIKFGLKGENTTISNSETNFWDSYKYAKEKIENGVEKVFLVAAGHPINDVTVNYCPDFTSELAVCVLLEYDKNVQQKFTIQHVDKLINNIQELAGKSYGFSGRMC